MMELRDFAKRVLLSPDLDLKLERPTTAFTDASPGPAERLARPVRPANLQFAPRKTAPAMPKGEALRDADRRAVAHHVMANHELQALEIMAHVLLAFPDAPAEFRFGLADVMLDEQRHTRLHAQRAAELGRPFGSLPVNSWIWRKAQEFLSPLEYVAGLPLVFEGANLDHTLEFEQAFRSAGDRRGADILRAIHLDEIRHVRFGLEWLRRFKPQHLSDWDAWTSALHWPLRPSRARGRQFQRAARRAAGLSDEFLDRLEAYEEENHAAE